MTHEHPLKTVNQKPVQARLTLQPPTPVLIWFSHWLPYIAAHIKISLSRAVSSVDWFGFVQEITLVLISLPGRKPATSNYQRPFRLIDPKPACQRH